MTEITREELGGMFNKQTEAIGGLVELKLAPIVERLDRVEQTLDTHTVTLDALVRNTEHWSSERTAFRSAVSRIEGWVHQLADKIGLKLR